jgi:ParB-like chromosome segregation protein Spo0J
MLSANPKDFYIVGLDGEEGESHPLYDERSYLPPKGELVRSLIAYGNKVPIVVRHGLNDRLEVVDGRGRVKAARVANERLAANNQPIILLAYIVDSESKADDVVAQSVSNLTNSVRFSDDPVTETNKTIRYLARLLGNPEEDEVFVAENARPEHHEIAAETFGCSAQTIVNRIKFSILAPGVIRLVRSGRLKYTTALQLSDLPYQEQEAKALHLIEDGATIQDARALVKASKAGTKAEKKENNVLGAVLLRRVVKLAEGDGKHSPISMDHIKVLKVVCGQLEVGNIPGLEELINRVEAGEKPDTGLVKKRK